MKILVRSKVGFMAFNVVKKPIEYREAKYFIYMLLIFLLLIFQNYLNT